MPQSPPATILIPKVPANTMVLWGRPSQVKSYSAYRPGRTEQASAGPGGDSNLAGNSTFGPIGVGLLATLAALVAMGWAWKKARSVRTQIPATVAGIALLFFGAFAFAVGFRVDAGASADLRRERNHWLGVAETVIDETLVERQASTRGFIRALDSRRMIYTSPKWLMVIDFQNDRFVAVPAHHIRRIEVPRPETVPSRLNPTPRLEDPVVSFIPGGQPKFVAPGAGPFSGSGPIRITTDIEQPAEILVQRGDHADLTPADEFIKRVSNGLDPVEHYRQRTNLTTN